MEKRVYSEEITQLALLYNYKATNKLYLNVDIIKKHEEIVLENLEKMKSKLCYNFPIDYAKLIYFNAHDENDVWYSVIKPGVDLERVEFDYSVYLDKDLEVASLKKNALDVLNIKIIAGEFVSKFKIDNKHNIDVTRCVPRVISGDYSSFDYNSVISAHKLENFDLPNSPKLIKKIK